MSNKDDILNFDQQLVREYFKFGSINKVFENHKYNLPISFAGFDRVLSKFGVVKSAGPNSKLSESLYILSLLANYKIPLERIYHHFAPKTIQVSTNTLHRILHYTRLGLTRRQGVILIVTPKDDPDMVLTGNDESLSSKSIFGKRGDISLPMGHSKVNEPVKDSIARILQNEVFTNSVVEKSFPWEMIPEHIKPIMHINITDIRVSVYKLELPRKHPVFSSFKLNRLRMRDISKIEYEKARPGIKEVLEEYVRLSASNGAINAATIESELNTKIFALAKEPVK